MIEYKEIAFTAIPVTDMAAAGSFTKGCWTSGPMRR